MELRIANGTDVPCDIWWRIMMECGPSEVQSLEKCCRLFHNLAKSRTIWLNCLQNLDPTEPPSIPIHVSPTSLGKSELRNIATSARRRTLLGESESSPKLIRETVISLEDANPDEVLGEPVEFGMHLCLVPGGEFLLIYWPAGYLQCWSVRDKACKWVYPDLPEGASEDRPKLLCYYDFEMQPNGDIRLLLIDEYLQGDEMGDMYPNILRFSPESSTLEKLYSGKQLKREYGRPVITKLRDNIIVMFQQVWGIPIGTLTVLLLAENKSTAITNISVECLEIVEGFIICVCNLAGGDKSLIAISLADLFKPASTANERVVPAADVISAAFLIEPKSYSLRKAQMTVNTLHWRPKADQQKVYITVLYKDKISKGTPLTRFVLNKPCGSSDSSTSPLLEALFDDDDDDAPLKLSGQTFASYSALTPPTLSNQSFVLLHSSNAPDESEYELALSTLSQDGKTKFKPLDLGVGYSETRALCTEFFSGAVLYATKNYNSIVIKHFE